MNKKALKVLEYDKIINMLANEAGCSESKKMAEDLVPYTEAHLIYDELGSTAEAVDLIMHKGPLPTGGLYDVNRSVSVAAKGSTLSMKELLEIGANLKIISSVVKFMKGDDIPDLPRIKSMTDLLVTHESLAGEIERCIVKEDEMSDSASPKLRSIRREMVIQNERIRTKLSSMVASQENRAFLQDSIVTMRDGRYVIPVKQEHRQKFPGMIHDQSKGGQTLFIEPQAIVEMNNRLRELEIEEHEEIVRILAELSSAVGECHKDLRNSHKLLVTLDFVMAKGKLSGKMSAETPKLGEGYQIALKFARHPLLKDKAVPISVVLEEGDSTLIITGPNTGGKTVSLKTVGLLSLMAQSGLNIPASSESRLPIFKEIYADIGDEQSIEQSLSTFSSHMKNIVYITKHGGRDSLILLDELGAGTDPTEGAALAISILESLKAKGATVLATTHYNELKKYALSEDGVKNASMEFDVGTLSPTYRLMIGVPGKSNAFEISRKLGLGNHIISRASDLIESGDMEFEDVISSISSDRMAAEKERQEAQLIGEEVRKREEKLRQKEEALSEKREAILSEARREAREIVREAKETSKELQKELTNLRKTGNSSKAEEKLEKHRRRIKNIEEKNAELVVKQVNSEPVSADDIKIGDRIKVLTLGQNGEVTSLPDSKGEIQVTLGAIRMTVDLKDIMLINEGKERKKPASSRTSGSSFRTKSRTVSASLNVQGENLEEALMNVEKYIDDVYLAGLEKVTIIHGRGSGILKSGIRRMLKENKLVQSFEPGTYNEGGEGVTIVTMRRN